MRSMPWFQLCSWFRKDFHSSTFSACSGASSSSSSSTLSSFSPSSSSSFVIFSPHSLISILERTWLWRCQIQRGSELGPVRQFLLWSCTGGLRINVISPKCNKTYTLTGYGVPCVERGAWAWYESSFNQWTINVLGGILDDTNALD